MPLWIGRFHAAQLIKEDKEVQGYPLFPREQGERFGGPSGDINALLRGFLLPKFRPKIGGIKTLKSGRKVAYYQEL